MERINTVTGTCTPDELGRTLVHEHLLVGYPGWQMDALAPPFKRDEAKARARRMDAAASRRTASRPSSIPVRWTSAATSSSWPRSLWRPACAIICTTGAYFEEQGLTYTFRNLPLDDIAAIYEKEITRRHRRVPASRPG